MNIETIKARLAAAQSTKRNAKPRAKRRMDKNRLPSPLVFYHQLGVVLKGGGQWRKAKCPFHNDNHPSMSVNTANGGFTCHACGAKGDMLKFYMQLKHVDFKTACSELDLWETYR